MTSPIAFSLNRYELLTSKLKQTEFEEKDSKADGLKYATFIQELTLRPVHNHKKNTNVLCDTKKAVLNDTDQLKNTHSYTLSELFLDEPSHQESKIENELIQESEVLKRDRKKQDPKFSKQKSFLNQEQAKLNQMAGQAAAKQFEVERLFEDFEIRNKEVTREQLTTETKSKPKTTGKTKIKFGEKDLNKKSASSVNRDGEKNHDDVYQKMNNFEILTIENHQAKEKEVNLRRGLIQEAIVNQLTQKNAVKKEEFLRRHHKINEIAKVEELRKDIFRYLKSTTKKEQQKSLLQKNLTELQDVYRKKHLLIDQTRKELFEVQKRNNGLLKVTTISCQNSEDQLKQRLRKEEEQIARVLIEKEEKLQALKKINMECDGEKYSLYRQIKVLRPDTDHLPQLSAC